MRAAERLCYLGIGGVALLLLTGVALGWWVVRSERARLEVRASPAVAERRVAEEDARRDLARNATRLFLYGYGRADFIALKQMWKQRAGITVRTPLDLGDRWSKVHADAYNNVVYMKLRYEVPAVEAEASRLAETLGAPPVAWIILGAGSAGVPRPLAGPWPPDPATVPNLIAGARRDLQRYAAEADRDGRYDFEIGEIPKIDAHWHRYRCQVVGYRRAGHRRIHLNFFLPAPPGDGVPSDYWRRGYVLIVDGGYGVWRVDYDVDQGRYLDFRSNGYG